MTEAAVDLARELLNRGQTLRFIARGQSMWPAILDGDRLTLAPRQGPIRLGEIVFLPTDDFGVAHRCVARLGPWCCLKGDAAVTIDGWYRQAAITARITRIDRDGRPIPIRATLGAVLASWTQSGLRTLARRVRAR